MTSDISKICKEGFLLKQSRHLKEWRKQNISIRRYFVLTPSLLISFKDQNKKKQTEAIILKECTTIKSADDEIHKQFSIVNFLNKRLDFQDNKFYLIASNNSEKESWIGAIGKLMVQLNVKKNLDSDDDD